jgi:hypothetical protein
MIYKDYIETHMKIVSLLIDESNFINKVQFLVALLNNSPSHKSLMIFSVHHEVVVGIDYFSIYFSNTQDGSLKNKNPF